MKYIHALKGGLLALIIFAIAAYVIQGKGPSEKIEIILTISTFLFAILSGFFISRLNTRFNTIREVTAAEDAHWLTLYKTSTLYGKSFSKKIANIIEKYFMICFDHTIAINYAPTTKNFLSLYDELNKIKKYRGESSFQSMLTDISAIEENRNKSSVLVAEQVSKGQWTILISLTGIITFCIFYLKIPEFYSQIITVILSTILILVLLMIRDLHNLRLGGDLLAVESGQEILESIGKLRYYGKPYSTADIPKYVKKFRLGFHEPGEKPKIKTVTRK
mgnify:CR=1 FL=1|jgi:hypothetical protein